MFNHLAAATLAAIVCAAAPTAAEAAAPSRMTSNQPAGMRGDTITFRVQLTSYGVPCANQLVNFYDCSDRRPYLTYRGSAWTDANGYARLTYRIPTNVNEDNVYLYGIFDGNGTTNGSYVATRIQIGRR